MNKQQLQNDKLRIINWITQLEDYSVIEKLKSLMSASNAAYVLTDEQKTLDSQVNEDKSHYIDAEKLYTDIMITLHPQYIKDTAGKNLVILSQTEFDNLIEELEDQEDIRLYDQAKKEDSGERILFSDYLKNRNNRNV